MAVASLPLRALVSSSVKWGETQLIVLLSLKSCTAQDTGGAQQTGVLPWVGIFDPEPSGDCNGLGMVACCWAFLASLSPVRHRCSSDPWVEMGAHCLAGGLYARLAGPECVCVRLGVQVADSAVSGEGTDLCLLPPLSQLLNRGRHSGVSRGVPPPRLHRQQVKSQGYTSHPASSREICPPEVLSLLSSPPTYEAGAEKTGFLQV